jgi:hypothetical protein
MTVISLDLSFTIFPPMVVLFSFMALTLVVGFLGVGVVVFLGFAVYFEVFWVLAFFGV